MQTFSDEFVKAVADDLFEQTFTIIASFHQEARDEYTQSIYDKTRAALESAAKESA